MIRAALTPPPLSPTMQLQPVLLHRQRLSLDILPDGVCAVLLCPFVPLRDRFYSLSRVSRRWRQLAWRSVHGGHTLDLTWCTGEHELEWVVKALAARTEGPPSKLEAFQLYGPRVDSSLLSHLISGVGLTQIRHVKIESKQIEDASLQQLRACGGLTHLSLDCVKLTSVALAEISRSCTKLQYVNLAGCSRVCDGSVIALAANCPQLSELNLFMCHRISDHSIVALSLRPQKSLRRVVVDRCLKVTGLALLFLMKSQPHLQALSFANCPKVQDHDFEALTKELVDAAATLEHIDMSGCASLGDHGATTLVARNAATLRSLHVRSLLTLSPTAFTSITQCTGLLKLNLSMCRTLQNTDLTRIVSACTKLETLKLQGCVHIDDDGAAGLACHGKQLQTLSLEFCYNITDEGFQQIISSCHQLRDLSVKAMNQLTSDAFDSLITLKSSDTPLQRINIGACADFQTTLMYASIIKRRYPRARIEWI